ncbi:hypothetical protein SBRCBS47491_002931 [Sporothrix bragantina]|uniref:Sialidase n=1 Tax=Sporothrix bragantina TaxID=671064 RepID=A0ABP0BB25_9PEZI
MSSSLAADVAFDFTFPSCDPATPPPPATSHSFSYDASSLLEIPFHHPFGHGSTGHHNGHGHARSSSQCSAYSAYSYASSTPSDAFLNTPAVSAPSTRNSTPARSPIRTHGPLLLPKIRSQDQALSGDADAPAMVSAPKRSRTSPAPTTGRSRSTAAASRRRSALVTPKQPYAASSGPAASRHVRSFTNPDSIMMFSASQQQQQQRAATPVSVFESTPPPPTLLCSPVSFVPPQSQLSQFTQPQQQQQQQQNHDDSIHSRRASTCSLDGSSLVMDVKFDYEYGFAPYPGTVPTNYLAAVNSQHGDSYLYQSQSSQQSQQQYMPRAPSPLSVGSASPEPVALPDPLSIPVSVPVITATPPSATSAPAVSGPTSSLVTYLTSANPAPALVRTISFPLRDPGIKHYWWDVRQVRPWSAFSMANLAALPGATSVLSCPVPVSLLPTPHASSRSIHPETESELHGLCAAHYLPRVNAALALSSPRPIQLTSSSTTSAYGEFFVGHAAGDSAPAAALFGGKPTARVVGLVKSFDRFNTGMRGEGNIKRVEYLRGLAHLHYLMREHSCRYGFIMTEIELVLVRNGTESTPFFGQLEVTSVPLAKTANDSEGGNNDDNLSSTPLTACLALWGLSMLASDEMAAAAVASPGNDLLCSHTTHIGAPAEGTRRKAAPRDTWMPQPQLAEKRAAKRARGWILPEDAVGRKEMGRRGVRYNGAH